MKTFFHKLRKDLQQLFVYPKLVATTTGGIDYDAYWSKRRGTIYQPILSAWQKKRADYLLTMIKPGATVLDLGCGDGLVLKYLRDHLQIKPIGVDFNSTVIAVAKAAGIAVITADITKVDDLARLPETDYVIGLEILEHTPNPEEIIFALAKKVRQAMIFSFPNTGYYLHRLRLLGGRFPLQWVVHPGEHLRFWTVRDVCWWVQAIGFRLDRLIIYEGLPGLNRLCPTLFGQGIIIKISQ